MEGLFDEGMDVSATETSFPSEPRRLRFFLPVAPLAESSSPLLLLASLRISSFMFQSTVLTAVRLLLRVCRNLLLWFAGKQMMPQEQGGCVITSTS
jgi:hypothetical protein